MFRYVGGLVIFCLCIIGCEKKSGDSSTTAPTAKPTIAGVIDPGAAPVVDPGANPTVTSSASDTTQTAEGNSTVLPIVCKKNEFKNVQTCQKLTLCAPTEVEVTLPTDTSDRVCKPLTVCREGKEFETTKPELEPSQRWYAQDRTCACQAVTFQWGGDPKGFLTYDPTSFETSARTNSIGSKFVLDADNHILSTDNKLRMIGSGFGDRVKMLETQVNDENTELRYDFSTQRIVYWKTRLDENPNGVQHVVVSGEERDGVIYNIQAEEVDPIKDPEGKYYANHQFYLVRESTCP